MQVKAIVRIVGLLVMLFSVTMLVPGLVAAIYKDGAGRAFAAAFALSLCVGFCLWFPQRYERQELKSKEGFLIVVLFWTVLGSVGSLPFIISDVPKLSVVDSLFESFSGLTTTGATVIVGIDALPKAILFYRQLLQWLGGMGIIVLAVAVLRILGVGGMQLYRAEIPGPVKDKKMTPRIAETAKALWYIYLFLTVGCSLAFWVTGMGMFDAICHSFATVAIGGFSTHDASLGYFDSAGINVICAIFLIISGMNYSLHFAAVNSGKRVTLKYYFMDPECRTFISIQMALMVICFAVLLYEDIYSSVALTFDQAFFQSVSISTTAGFTTSSFSEWPLFLPVMLIFSSFIGGCAGSTGGGVKVIRVLLLYLQGARELKRLIHPRGVFQIKIGSAALPDRVLEAVWGFFAAYVLVFIVCMILLIAAGMEELSAFSAIVACLNNLGPGLGEVALHYGTISDMGKWTLIVTMLFGRLEVFTLLVIFTPAFWRS
jgi:trk system potassium uptake protein TrkH